MPEYKLPDVGEGLTEAEIVTWKVKVGDVIAINDIVVEIETAKSLVELPSPYAGEVTARITEECFYSLEAPVLRVCGFDTPYPPSRIEEEWLPDLDRVLDAVDRSLAY